MKTSIVLALLALLTITGAVLEGLVEGLSPHMIQANGLLTIICAGVFVFLTLKTQIDL